MATAKKLPSGKYRCLVYTGKGTDGKREYKSFTADTKKEAEYKEGKEQLAGISENAQKSNEEDSKGNKAIDDNKPAIWKVDGKKHFIVMSITNVGFDGKEERISYMLDNYQVDLMMFQDGGGSVGMYDARRDVLIAGEREGKNGRPVATVICVKE